MRIHTGLAAVLFLTCTARAGSIVAFSYTFQDQTTVKGTVEGDLLPNGDQLTGLRNLNAVYSGQPNTPLRFVPPPLFVTYLSLSGTMPFHFEGFATDPSIGGSIFGVYLSNDMTADAVTVGTFGVSSTQINFPQGSAALEADSFRSGSFSASIVPEPASVVLAGTGLSLVLGCFACRSVSRKRGSAE
jgi:hypothetical protein